MKSVLKILLILMIIFSCSLIMAQSNPGQVFTLANGLRVFIKPVHSTPVVALNIWVKAGSVNEEAGQEGYASLIERVMFKSTPTYPDGALDNEIKKIGARQNAFTANDYTCYYLVGASEYFDKMFELEAEAVLHNSFDEQVLAREAQAVLEEMRLSLENPNDRIVKLMMKTAFNEHPYRHPIIGYKETIESVTREKLYAFYRKFYVPSNMWVVIVGDVDAAKALKTVEKYMGSVPNTPLPAQRLPEEPPQNGMRVGVENADLQYSYIRLAWRVPGIKSVDKYPLYVISKLVGGGSTSWLWKELVESRQLAVSAGAGYYSSQFPMLFQVGGVTTPGKARQFVEAARTVIYRLADGEITSEEIEKARQQIISEDIFESETVEKQATNYGHFAMLADVNDADEFINNIRAVTIEDIRRVATEFFNDSALTVVRLDPQSSPVDALPEMITLDNGIRLILKENHSSPIVSVSVKIAAGGLREEKREAGLANLTAELLAKGANSMSAEEIAENFEKMGSRYSVEANKSFVTFSLQSISENFAPSLELFLDIIKNPDFPSEELDKMKKQVENLLVAEEEDLYHYTCGEALKAVFPDSPIWYSTNGIIDDLQQLKRSNLQEFYKKYYVGSNMVVAIVGDFYLSEVKDTLLAGFGRFNQGKTRELRDYGFKDITAPILVNLKKNREQAQVIYVSRTFQANDEKTAAMAVAQTILSGGASSRLFKNLHDKDFLASSVWAYNVGMANAGYFLASIASDADKVASAAARLKEEIDLFRDKGFTDQEFEDAKKYIAGQYSLTMVDSLSMADNFASDELLGKGFDFYRKYPGLINAVTREQVNEVARSYLLASGSYGLAITTP